MPELFIRAGADRDVSFVDLATTRPAERDAELKRALVQLVTGKADDDEKGLIRSELAGDSVILERAEVGVETESEVAAALAAQTGSSSIRPPFSSRPSSRLRR
jgi:hypothetical protein